LYVMGIYYHIIGCNINNKNLFLYV
jgi:hypothetical protein